MVYVSFLYIKYCNKTLPLQGEHIIWKPSFASYDNCICTPFSNALLEWLLSQMNHIKTNLRKSLTNNSLYSTYAFALAEYL